ncbi:MAG: hypothetical protein U5N26_07995 [Candidatus Marinimicrobia bacterium]|nr:hypothetical protein [Candidatus Neomarinimicrobiota bacterium]
MSELQELIRDIAEQHGAVIEDIGISDAAGKIKVVCDTEEGISSEKLNGISKAILNDPLYDEKYAEGVPPGSEFAGDRCPADPSAALP